MRMWAEFNNIKMLTHEFNFIQWLSMYEWFRLVNFQAIIILIEHNTELKNFNKNWGHSAVLGWIPFWNEL